MRCFDLSLFFVAVDVVDVAIVVGIAVVCTVCADVTRVDVTRARVGCDTVVGVLL